jgi:signal transduction histidine kinase
VLIRTDAWYVPGDRPVDNDDASQTLVEAFWQAVEDGDEARLRELCAADFVVARSDGRTFDFEEWVALLGEEAAIEAFEDFEVVVEEVVVGEDAVAVRGRAERTQVEPFVGVEPGDGDVSQPFASVFEFDGDAIASVQHVMDEGRFLRDLGVLPGDSLAWKQRQQHRDVLTSILRHDLRNDLNAALLRAEEIPDETIRRDVLGPIEQLLTLVEKTRHLDRYVVEQNVYPEPVDVPDLVRSVVDDLAGDPPDATVATEFSGRGPTVRTDPRSSDRHLNPRHDPGWDTEPRRPLPKTTWAPVHPHPGDARSPNRRLAWPTRIDPHRVGRRASWPWRWTPRSRTQDRLAPPPMGSLA